MKYLLALCFLLVSGMLLHAQQSKYNLDDLKWLVGAWEGKGLGGDVAEVWDVARGNAMMGMFKLVKDDKVVFTEMMSIMPGEEGLELRVKHFHANFVAWEEKENYVTFKLLEAGENFANFSGLSMKREGEQLRLALRMRTKEGELKEEVFEFRRISYN